MSMFKGATKLATGNGLAQVITLISYVVLARVYTPGDFGLLATVAGIGTIGGTAASLRYDFTVLLPRRRRGADLAAYASLIVAICTCLVLTVCLFVVSYFADIEWVSYWWLIGPMTLALALINILGFIQNREKRYSQIASVQVLRALAMLSASVSLIGTQAGLVYGHAVGAIAGAATAMLMVKVQDGRLFRAFSGKRVRAWLSVRRDFLKYSFPAVFVSSVASQLPVFLFAAYVSEAAAGFFSLINRTVAAPTNLVSRAINKVYLQEIASRRAARVPIADIQTAITKKTAAGTIGISIIFVLFCLFGGYETLFGSQWVGLGETALMMVPVLFIGFVAKSVSSFAVLDRNELGLGYQLLLLVITFCSIYLPHRFGFDFEAMVATYSIAVAFVYAAQVIAVHLIARRDDRTHFRML